MKRTLKYALTAVLGVAMIAPAFGQDNFPDTPENHWAYEALGNLKREGILVGYPDGFYRGPRNATRYEMAVAINAAYQKLMSMHNGLADQIKALQEMIEGKGGGGDIKGLKDQLTALQAQVDSMKGWGDDVASLKRMAATFEKELASMGVDVEGMKKDLADLEKRVKVLENTKLPVAISGDVNIVVHAGNSRNNTPGMTKDGKIVGVNDQGAAAVDTALPTVGLTRDMDVFHEMGITLKGTNDTGPQWMATLVYGNMIGSGVAGRPFGYGDMNNRFGGTAYRAGSGTSFGGGDWYIQDLAVSFNTSLIGQGFSAEIGRVATSVAPYLFQRKDNTPYFDNARWDDGKYRIDGGILNFGFGKVGLKVFGGKMSGITSGNGTELNGISAAAVTGVAGSLVDTVLGAELNIPIGEIGSVKAAYIYQDSDAVVAAATPNRLNTLGGTGTFKFGNITVNGGYGKTIMTRNTGSLGLDNNNQSAYANAAYDAGNWGIKAEYRKIQWRYMGQGTWRRLGTNWNPTNVQTVMGNVWFKPTEGLQVGYRGEFGDTIQGFVGLPAKTKIESHVGWLEYKLNEAWMVGVAYEDFRLKLAPANLKQRWASAWLDYNLGKNSMLGFGYEYGSVQNPIAWGQGAAGTYRGGFFTSQLSIKF